MVKKTAKQCFVTRPDLWDGECGFGAQCTLVWRLEREKAPHLYFYVSEVKAGYLWNCFSGAN